MRPGRRRHARLRGGAAGGRGPPDRLEAARPREARRADVRPPEQAPQARRADAARSRGARPRGEALDAPRAARPVRGHGRERPGEPLRVDAKRVARVPGGGGWRADPSSAPRGSGAGWACPHAAVDDRSRVAYAGLLGDERGATCAGFAPRRPASFAALGVRVERVMADVGPGRRSREFNDALSGRGVAHKHTRPHGPWQNGKVERMNRTIAQERQYGRAWSSEGERAEALPAFVEHHNWGRPHSACGGLRPFFSA
ncbi:MAG: integrase core domain-containing protein [Atopobiaceae bacterium]|nr:integrase core domain-containing protein [Atopobiaceae bacterium]